MAASYKRVRCYIRLVRDGIDYIDFYSVSKLKNTIFISMAALKLTLLGVVPTCLCLIGIYEVIRWKTCLYPE